MGSFFAMAQMRYMDVSKNGGTQQPWVFLLKMIILGCFGGTPTFGNTHIISEIFGGPTENPCAFRNQSDQIPAVSDSDEIFRDFGGFTMTVI